MTDKEKEEWDAFFDRIPTVDPMEFMRGIAGEGGTIEEVMDPVEKARMDARMPSSHPTGVPESRRHFVIRPGPSAED